MLNTSNECVICLEALYKTNVVSLKCNHLFHTSCIKEWVSYKNKCPICSSKIDDIIQSRSKTCYKTISQAIYEIYGIIMLCKR